MTEGREKRRERRRLSIVAAFLGLFAVALVVQLVRLMIVAPAREGEATLVMPEVERGAILDRNGTILAITTRQQRVSAWIPGVTNAQESAALLSKALGLEGAALLENWRRRDGYALVKRKVSAAEAEEIRRLKSDGKLAGIRLEDEFGRFYPEGSLASHVLGYVGIDNVALDGIEYTFNDDLAPQTVGTDTETVFGNTVLLTIDVGLQYQVEKAARAALQANKADSLMVLVMDARSAEILAYCALPDFNPNVFQNESPRVDRNSMVNRPLVLAYEPGSVFKVFSLASLLAIGAITPESRFYCDGFYEKKVSNGETIRIRCISKHGEVTAGQVIEYSCNAGAAYASDAADAESFAGLLVRFGFGKSTKLPLPGETAGILSKPSKWSLRSKPTIAIGQEISVSAVQVLAAATAIANGGVLLKPTIVKKIVSPEGRVLREFGREPVQEVVSPQVAHSILDMMETATSPAGTARRAAVPGVRISAKTGTAQVTNRETGTYSENDFIASILGIFPSEDPRLIVYVVIQNPRGESYFGSTIAAPVFHDVAVDLIDSLGIPRTGSREITHTGSLSVPAPRPAEISSVMPDLTGTPKKLLLPLLLREDISVMLRGNGYVVAQDPAPGTKIEKGMKITLELE